MLARRECQPLYIDFYDIQGDYFEEDFYTNYYIDDQNRPYGVEEPPHLQPHQEQKEATFLRTHEWPCTQILQKLTLNTLINSIW